MPNHQKETACFGLSPNPRIQTKMEPRCEADGVFLGKLGLSDDVIIGTTKALFFRELRKEMKTSSQNKIAEQTGTLSTNSDLPEQINHVGLRPKKQRTRGCRRLRASSSTFDEKPSWRTCAKTDRGNLRTRPDEDGPRKLSPLNSTCHQSPHRNHQTKWHRFPWRSSAYLVSLSRRALCRTSPSTCARPPESEWRAV